MNNAAGAERVLAKAAGLAAENRTGFQLALGQVEYALGQREAAVRRFKQLLLGHPLAQDAEVARAMLTEMGAEANLTPAELRGLGDAYYGAGRYGDAAEQYGALLRTPALSNEERNTVAVARAACDLKLKRLTVAEVQGLPDTADENGARRLYLLMELARDRDDTAEQQRIVEEMEQRFAASPWLAEALFSSGNMYMLKHDYPAATAYYEYLAAHFPDSKNAAAAHWRAGWLNYRQGSMLTPRACSTTRSGFIPWPQNLLCARSGGGGSTSRRTILRPDAAANYRAIIRAYQHYFYAQLARARLAALGNTQPIDEPQLERFQPVSQPRLADGFPADSPHLAKARLLANAGLNEYISEEIAADPDSSPRIQFRPEILGPWTLAVVVALWAGVLDWRFRRFRTG